MSGLPCSFAAYTGISEPSEVEKIREEPENAIDLSKLPLGIQFLQKRLKSEISCTAYKILVVFCYVMKLSVDRFSFRLCS